MTENLDKADLYLQSVFQNGVEGYDPLDANSSTKGVVNPGGAKIFYHATFRSNRSRLVINRPAFEKVLKDAPIILYTLNKVELDQNGNPARVGGSGYRRIAHGLMGYVDYNNATPEIVKGLRDRIVASSPDTDISSHVKCFSDIEDPDGKIREYLSKVEYQNFARESVKVESPDRFIIMALPSGAPGSQQFWSFVNNRVSSRENMSQSITMNGVETDGLSL